MRSLLRSKPELRGQLAIELYRQGKVSLSRAAEIGGVDMESFKALRELWKLEGQGNRGAEGKRRL